MDNQEFQGGYNPEDGMYYAKGSYDNEVEYNNEIICLANTNHAMADEVHQTIAAQQFSEAREQISHWENDLRDLQQDLARLGSYDGDDELFNHANHYFEAYLNLLENDLKPYLNAIEEGNSAKIDELADSYNSKRNAAEMQLGQALQEFLGKYGDDDDYDENFQWSDAPMQQVDFDENNPLLQPIHGVSLYDYSAACAKIANGMSEDTVAKAFGIERPQWDEANQLWQKRMQQDTDFTVAGLFGQYFAVADGHPKFEGLESDFKTNEENLRRIEQDAFFYHELSGAMQAAYQNGMDGAQWLRENYGLSIGDFQSVAMQWAMSPGFAEMVTYQQEKVKEYSEKFSKENGGGIADDIEF